jgi:hypothetical protein
MACRVDVCQNCEQYDCPAIHGGQCKCKSKNVETVGSVYLKSDTIVTAPPAAIPFDIAGALCDVLSILEENSSINLLLIDVKTIEWWRAHEKSEISKTKREALAKLTAKEKRALGFE